MSFVNKQLVFGASDFRFGEVDVPEWGGKLRVRELSGDERSWCDQIGKAIEAGKPGQPSYAAAIIVCGAVDETGASLFARADAAGLSKKADVVLQRVAIKILELSNATVQTQVDAEKN